MFYPKKYAMWLLTAFIVLFNGAVLAVPAAQLWERWNQHNPASTETIDHNVWDVLLKRYVGAHRDGINRVAYSRIGSHDAAVLKTYIKQLGKVKISHYNRDEQRAYWINLYNALTVSEILDHYPITSIRDIRSGIFTSGPWQKELIEVEAEALTLDDIEHRILRPIWRDPRLHYAVNCASLSCPNLQLQAFTADNTEQLLERGAHEYVNHSRGVNATHRALQVSSIYDWFVADFGGSEAGVIAHIKKYAEPALLSRLKNNTRIDDDFYDWSLNGVKRVSAERR